MEKWIVMGLIIWQTLGTVFLVRAIYLEIKAKKFFNGKYLLKAIAFIVFFISWGVIFNIVNEYCNC